MYVFHHPQDEARNLKAGKSLKGPTYIEAQEEIVQQSGLMSSDMTNKSKGDLLISV